MSAPTLEGSSKVPIGLSPVTGERYFPVTFNCMKELHNITQTAEKSNFSFLSEDESAKSVTVKHVKEAISYDRGFTDVFHSLINGIPPVRWGASP